MGDAWLPGQHTDIHPCGCTDCTAGLLWHRGAGVDVLGGAVPHADSDQVGVAGDAITPFHTARPCKFDYKSMYMHSIIPLFFKTSIPSKCWCLVASCPAHRLFIVSLCVPVLSKIGYSLSWQHAVVISWGGLRGAVGLALALVVVQEATNYPGSTLDAIGDHVSTCSEHVLCTICVCVYFLCIRTVCVCLCTLCVCVHGCMCGR